LIINWSYTLGFGLDKDAGFFLCTFDEVPDSEFMVMASFHTEGVEIDTTFEFLNARISDLDLNIDSAVFVDLVAPGYLRREGDMPGRLTMPQIRTLNQPSDLFKITAVAGATISSSA